MNEIVIEKRKRHQTLLIVEGNHEKNILFDLMFKSFPEINIQDVLIYGTNIYMLYEDIAKEYNDWELEDVDLAYIISNKLSYQKPIDKYSFNNIFIIFDYERHDPNFSEEKILQMQKYFVDETDMGKLYINYPMVESYQHLTRIPDEDFMNRKIPVSLKPGKQYKNLIKRESIIREIIYLPYKIDDYLNKNLKIEDDQLRMKFCNIILNITNDNYLSDNIYDILENSVEENKARTAKYLIKDWLIRLGNIDNNQSYWEYIRYIFIYIVYINICKCYFIQNDELYINDNKECYDQLDMINILEKQNKASCEEDGFIWVLNTCVLLLAEYRFFGNNYLLY